MRTGIAYCRVSTVRQRDAETIQAQINTCRQLIERHGIKLLPYGPKKDGWVIDDGVSGTLLEGRAFATLIDDLESKKVKPDTLIVYSASRIARVDKSSTSGAKIIQSHKDDGTIRGVLIASKVMVIDGEGESNPAHVMFGIKSLISSDEHTTLRTRTKDGKSRRLREGAYARGGRPPYGYQMVPIKGDHRRHGWTLAPDPVASKRLVQILQWFVEGGVTHAAKRATAAKFETPMAKTTNRTGKAKDWTPTRWSPVSVQHIARNVRQYLGETVLEWDGVPHTLTFEPIIDNELCQAVDRRRKLKTLKRRAEFLSTGLVDCECGQHIHEKNSHDKHYTRCTAGCGSVLQSEFEAVLWNVVICRLIQIKTHERSTRGGQDPYGPSLKAAKGRLAAVQVEIDRNLDAYTTGLLDKPSWSKKQASLMDRKSEAQAEIDRIAKDKKAHEEKRASEQSVEAQVEIILKGAKNHPTLETKRKALGKIIGAEKVIVTYPKRPKARKATLSPYASLTLPSFGALPPVTIRTDRDPWLTMEGVSREAYEAIYDVGDDSVSM